MNIDYDEISPITGNKCVVVEAEPENNVISYICMESGYTTTDQLVTGGLYIEQYEAKLTELMIDAKFEDEKTKLTWYPTFMQMPGGEERLEYPIPGREGEYYTSTLDVENANIYDTGDFKIALDELYNIVKETIEHEQQ